ncbi:MAG: N-acetylmuramoyl-L-alanine amidase, partial [Candidatus Aminicenantes bacterium]|nr:N-acetylmuramoyl-L-alanine amidase [Candidatus Aminicenantes bacterium]
KTSLFFFFLLIGIPLLSLTINIRTFDHDGFTRIVFEGDQGFQFKTNLSSSRLNLELDRIAHPEEDVLLIINSKLVDKVVHIKENQKSVFSVFFKQEFEIQRNFVLERPFRVVFDLVKSEKSQQVRDPLKSSSGKIFQDSPQNSDEPENQANFDSSQSKQKKSIETICIDPGHGGSDFGAIGQSNLKEKDITLKVGKTIKRIIESRLGIRVIITRDKDSEVSLNSRVSIANNQKADMFISIHVNSSFRKAARGPETFFVSLKATDQESFDLAQKENRSFDEIGQITEKDDLKMILWNMAQTEFIRESSKLAEYIQNELNVLMHTINRGVKQAPFRVLMRAAMPAVLVEISFISNPVEERKLKDDSFLQKVARSIYNGISKFIYYHDTMNR